MSDGPAALDVEDALDRLGFGLRRLSLLSAPSAMKRGRSSYRADLEDGRTLKARYLESAEEARRLFELRAEPADAFVQPIARHSRVLVEPWIQGAALGPREAENRAEEAGALMGSLHANPLSGAPARVDTRDWRGFAREELEHLGSTRALAAPEVGNLRALLSQDDPRSGCAALVHRDYCPENLLVDRLGRLRVVDNEWFKIDAAGWDVARTFCLWPMAKRAREDFLRGYRTTAPEEPGSLAFWEVVAALWTLRLRREHAPERLDRPLAGLRKLGGV